MTFFENLAEDHGLGISFKKKPSDTRGEKKDGCLNFYNSER